MNTLARRLVAVSALAIGFSGLAVAVSTAAQADKICIVNGVQAPCKKPDYANDCEGELRRTDCGGEYDNNGNKAPKTEPRNDAGPTSGDGGTAPSKKKAAPKAPTTNKKSTTTIKGGKATTVTVEEAPDAPTQVTVEEEPAQTMTERRIAFRFGSDDTIEAEG